MFTGLIQKVGRISAVATSDGGRRLRIGHAPWDTPVTEGESIAVSGVCLTVAEVTSDGFAADVLEETVSRSTLGAKQPGAPVNLERALRMGDPVGGHFVSGHVDTTGVVSRFQHDGRDRILRIACGSGFAGELVEKGSVACDGVSLTVARLGADSFEVHIIPHTREHTAFSETIAGSAVNLESDLLGKFVRRGLDGPGAPRSLTMDDLGRAGFLDDPGGVV